MIYPYAWWGALFWRETSFFAAATKCILDANAEHRHTNETHSCDWTRTQERKTLCTDDDGEDDEEEDDDDDDNEGRTRQTPPPPPLASSSSSSSC